MSSFLLTLLVAAALESHPGFDEAMQVYRRAEFEQALVLLQDLRLNATLGEDDRTELLIWTALCHAQLGDDERALRDLESAAERDPDVVLPKETPPKLKEAFETFRRAHAKPPPKAAPAPEPGPEPPKPWTPQRRNTVIGGLVGLGVGAAVAGVFAVDYGFASAAEGDPRAEGAKQGDLVGLGVAGGMALTSGLIAFFATVWPAIE